MHSAAGNTACCQAVFQISFSGEQTKKSQNPCHRESTKNTDKATSFVRMRAGSPPPPIKTYEESYCIKNVLRDKDSNNKE
jgi:hypothetical protein